MKATLYRLFTATLLLVAASTVFAQTSGKAVVNKQGASVNSSKGGGATANKQGTEIKNSRGAGVEAKKGEVSAKNSAGKGAEVNNKGVNVSGSKGGMTIDKKKLEIKSKKVNIKIGG